MTGTPRQFAQAGFASVVYDNRNFGASDGEPRQEIDPWLQIRDYSDAITFAQSLDQTDPTRIGVWGSSYSGAHVLVVAAIDRRVKCVVSQVPAISGSQGFRRLVRADFIAPLEAQLHADRVNRAAGGAPAMLPVVAADPTAPSALPTADSYKWFTETAAARAPSWRNEVTLRTLEYAFGYEPGAYIGLISPTPLLLIVAVKDHLAVSDLAIAAYERAFEPKTPGPAAGWALRGLRRGVRSIVRPGLRLVSRPPWIKPSSNPMLAHFASRRADFDSFGVDRARSAESAMPEAASSVPEGQW